MVVRRAQGRFQSASVSRVNTVLQRFGVQDMQRLFPAAKHKAKLRRAKAPNGQTIVEHNLDQVFCIQLNSLRPDSTLLLASALDSLKEVEYAEPNYVAVINKTSPQPFSPTPALPERGGGSATLQANEEDDISNAASSLLSDGSIETDGSWESNPFFNQQYGLVYEGLPSLWVKPVVNKKRPVIAIIDTGVDIDHPDLKANIWTNPKEEEGEPGYDNDGNGFIGDVHGWDFINNTPDIRDYNSHGTHCAGIAAAVQNGIGIIGANPRALIMPVTVMQSDGTGDVATIARGIDYAAQNGATVISMSLGTYGNSRVLRQALENAYHSAVLVAAAGNDGLPIYRDCAISGQLYGPMFPAAYSFVLGVQATNDSGNRCMWSNYDCDGPNYSAETSPAEPEGYNYELAAPGLDIISTVIGGSYKQMSGTSMAAPLMAGGISALQMVKNYDSQEILWGDLLHSSNLLGAYNIQQRPAELDFLGMQMRDRKELKDGEIDDNSYASNDGEADAGETLKIYPIIRTTFGEAKNIRLRLEMGDEYEDKTLVNIITPTASFGMNLSAYGKGVSVNPLVMKISPSCADARHIKMKVVASADGTNTLFEQKFTLTVSNMHKIGGLITKDSTLTADKTWYVTDNIAIPQGITLTIEPGTRLEFAAGTGLSSFGKLVAKGTPEKPIIFTRHSGEGSWAGVKSHISQAYMYSDVFCNADTTKFTLGYTGETPFRLNTIYSNTYYFDPFKENNPYKSFNIRNYLDIEEITKQLSRNPSLAYDPSFITDAVLKMISDFKAWNDTCQEKYSTYVENISNEFSNSLDFYVSIWFENARDSITHCKLSYCDFSSNQKPLMYDCEISNVVGDVSKDFEGQRCVLANSGSETNYISLEHVTGINASNYVNNYIQLLPKYSSLNNSNYINTVKEENTEGKYKGRIYWITNDEKDYISVDHADHPSYLGTAREDLVRPYCYEIGNAPNTFGKIDLSNMLKEPVHEAHGIVWKVVVDGKDAQDEYEDLAPLGVGTHKFCVWFNRPMNVNKAPQISFGVREPYTQIAVADNGSWSADSTKYTAYVTITGKTASDGICQIYVRGAEDNEFFECPYEKTRFRVQVQAAGSMATGFMAEPGMGKVRLTWNNTNNDFADAMGFNVYRILDADTIRINKEIIPVDTTSFTDFDVIPGKTYNYYYKVLSTDLREYDISNVVAATVLTSEKGDANGSGAVDVADVIATVNYSVGDKPQPFLFDAADMNDDKNIDVLDVVGIIEKILGKKDNGDATASAIATYTVEDGTVYVDCPVALAGMQVQVTMDNQLKPKAAADLEGFEQASAWLSDNDFIFLSYNMNGKTIPAGRHALLNIGAADLTSLCLSDAHGHNVQVVSATPTGISNISKRMLSQKGIYTLDGRKVSADASRINSLPSGVYIVNGSKVIK